MPSCHSAKQEERLHHLRHRHDIRPIYKYKRLVPWAIRCCRQSHSGSPACKRINQSNCDSFKNTNKTKDKLPVHIRPGPLGSLVLPRKYPKNSPAVCLKLESSQRASTSIARKKCPSFIGLGPPVSWSTPNKYKYKFSNNITLGHTCLTREKRTELP